LHQDTATVAEPDELAQDRLAEAAQGVFVSADAVEEWLASWFTPDELPPPDPDIRVTT
jgi:predicted transcriptional regulator